jgi:hypothetical protein
MLTSRHAAFTLAVSIAIAVTPPVAATSGLNIGPLAKADDVSVQEPLIGNTLAIESSEATPLFGTDRSRVDRFKVSLASAITARLTAAGLPIKTSSPYSVSVSLFGGTFKDAACPTRVFYSLEVWVSGPGDTRASRERVVLGVVDDTELEARAITSATAVIDELLSQRERFRKSKP